MNIDEIAKMFELKPKNSRKFDKYPYYHACIYQNDGKDLRKFDLVFDEVVALLNKYKTSTFKVIATVDDIESCVKYINRNFLEPLFEKEYIFKTNDYGLFVDFTEDFVKCINNQVI